MNRELGDWIARLDELNYYDVLDLPPFATQDEVQAGFHVFCTRFHPDRHRARTDDGLTLVDCRISNAVRCVPPQNKPLPSEINTCRTFLAATIATMPKVVSIVLLGRIAHDSTVKALEIKAKDAPFAHGAVHRAGHIRLYDSYHCSRYNTNTRVLTPDMFREIFARVRKLLDKAR